MRSNTQNGWLSLLTAGSIVLSCAAPIVAQEIGVAPVAPPVAPADSQVLVRDVRLGEDGLLTTRVIDAQGNPLAGEPVIISHEDQRIAQAVSDEQGLIRVRGLRPGVHTIQTQQAVTAVRLWTNAMAPPSAIDTPGLISDETVVRGQNGLLGAPGLGTIINTGLTIGTLIVAIDAAENAQDASDQITQLRRELATTTPASP